MVARLVRDQKVAGSNPVTSTRKEPEIERFLALFYSICTKRRLWRFFHATNVQPCGKGQRQGPLLGGGFGGFLEPGAKRSQLLCISACIAVLHCTLNVYTKKPLLRAAKALERQRDVAYFFSFPYFTGIYCSKNPIMSPTRKTLFQIHNLKQVVNYLEKPQYTQSNCRDIG